ncbi:MAG: nicotinate-nucleotide adenylyltransferase [Anaerolineae bacterium]|nr:nicotinate-nucleotide adenylyltransferase [Anaerolineae bacterium]
MTRIGIFGGTFDPPHLGHLILAETCADMLDLEYVLWVPAADPPHKRDRNVSSAQHRVAMIRAAIAGNARFVLSRVDVDRYGPQYSADTARIIAKQYSSEELFFLMGGDSLHDLLAWRDPDLLIERCHIGAVRRPGDKLEDVIALLYERFPMLERRLHVVEAPYIQISGTDIRERVHKGWSLRYRVPDKVIDYIQKVGLYQED